MADEFSYQERDHKLNLKSQIFFIPAYPADMKMYISPLSSMDNTVYCDFGAKQQGKLLIVLKPFPGGAE